MSLPHHLVEYVNKKRNEAVGSYLFSGKEPEEGLFSAKELIELQNKRKEIINDFVNEMLLKQITEICFQLDPIATLNVCISHHKSYPQLLNESSTK